MALFLYGWTLNPRIHWIVPIIGTAIVNFCMLLAVLSTENYLVDVYEIRTTSIFHPHLCPNINTNPPLLA